MGIVLSPFNMSTVLDFQCYRGETKNDFALFEISEALCKLNLLQELKLQRQTDLWGLNIMNYRHRFF